MWHVCGIGEVFVGRPEVKRPLRKRRRRWKDNIKWIFKRYDRSVGAWTGSGQGQVAGCCERGNESSGLIKCGKFLD
jgi:hypothetical protein